VKTAHDRESFELSWDLPHSRKKVWRALTESDLLERWIMPNDLRPVVGHQFTFRQPPSKWWDGVVYGEVLEVVALERLRYTWKAWRKEDGSFGLNTIVVWTLSPSASGGTHLQLRQSGFAPDAGPAFAGARAGWDRHVKVMLESLGQLPEEPLP
jgi:uncharacterized protein YndB with AHSA1/START domain